MDFERWLPAWLGGDIKDSAQLVDRLNHAAKATPGLAFELSSLPYGRLTLFAEALLNRAPEQAEICLAVDERPAVEHPALDGWLGLKQGRPLRAARSYLFVRWTGESDQDRRPMLDDFVRWSAHIASVTVRALNTGEIQKLLRPWALAALGGQRGQRGQRRQRSQCGQRVPSDVVGLPAGLFDNVAALSLTSVRGARHPLQTVSLEPASEVASWSFTRLTRCPPRVLERKVWQSRSPVVCFPGLTSRRPRREDASALEDALHRGEAAYWSDTVHLLGGSSRAVREEIDAAVKRYRRHGFQAQVSGAATVTDVLDALPWIRSGQGQRRRSTRRGCLRPAAEAAAMWPVLQGVQLGTTGSGLWLRNHRGAPVRLDPLQRDGNYNTLILGLAGSGCTFVSNAMLGAHLETGGRAWALRWGSCEMFDGRFGVQHIRLDPENVFSVNPLGGLNDTQAFFDALPVLKAWLYALAGLEGDDVTERDRTLFDYLIEPVLHAAWRDAGAQLGLARVLAELERQPLEGGMLAARIRRGIAGLSPTLFEGRSAFDESASYLSIDTSGYEKLPEEKVLARTVLALYCLALPRLGYARPLMLVVDEAEVLGSQGAARLLELALRRARPLGAQVVLTDHPFSAQARNQRSHHRVMDGHCSNKVLLRAQPEYAEGWLQRVEGVDPRALLRETRSSLQRSSFVWHNESTGQAELLELELPSAVCAVLQPRAQELFVYRAAKARGLSHEQALDEALQPQPKNP